MTAQTWSLPTELQVGIHSARPAVSAVGDGALYSCTTHGLVYQMVAGVWGTWLNLSAGFTNPMTTKGDLIIGDTGGSPIRKAVGSDTQVLTADAASTGGIKWATPAAGGGGYELDDYVLDGTYGDDFTGSSLSGIWTRRNFTSGAETYQLGQARTYMRVAMTGRAAGDGYFETAPAGDWTFAMAFVPRAFAAPFWVLAVINSVGTGLGITFADVGGGQYALTMLGVTTYTTYSGVFVNSTTEPAHALNTSYNTHKVWLYLRKSGTNYYGAYSKDGELWSAETPAFSSAITVDRVGMFVHPQPGITTTAIVDVDWFNKIA